MAIHRFFFGDRTRCAQLYPFARSKLDIVRQVLARSGQTAASKRYDLTTGEIVFLYVNGTEEYIYIHAGDWLFATMGWLDDEHYIRVSKSLVSFPRRLDAEEGTSAFSREHLLSAEASVYFARTPEDADDVRTARVNRRGMPFEGFTISPGGSSFLVGTPRTMYAALYEEPIFAFGVGAYGSYYWTDVTGMPKFFRTLDDGETLQVYELNKLDSLDGDPFDTSVAGTDWYVGPVNKELLLAIQAMTDNNGHRTVVSSSADGGENWAELTDLVRLDYTGSSSEYQVTTPWDDFDMDFGGTVSEEDVEDWAHIFTRTLMFYTMADRILMFGFVVTHRDSEGEEAGYWRAFISTDDGASWTAGGVIAVAVQDSEARTILTDPGFFRQPVVLPDNRILSIQAGGPVSIADQDASQFDQIATFPVTDPDHLGVPSPVNFRGEFKVTVTAFTGSAVVVYMNTDDTYTTWVIVGTVEEMDSLPVADLPVLYPFTRVLGLMDSIDPAFPDAFAGD